jgi:hypothetical protein
MSFESVLTLLNGRKSQVDAWLAPNFSFKEIAPDLTIEIKSSEQMIVNDRIRVEGFLKIDGEAYVCQMPEPEPFPVIPGDNFSFYEVTEFKSVPFGQEMLVTESFRVSTGGLQVGGKVAVLADEVELFETDNVPNFIDSLKSYRIAEDFEQYFRSSLKISGKLKVEGSFAIGA